MALYNIIRCNTGTFGTGTIQIGVPVTPFLAFSGNVPNGTMVSYGVDAFNNAGQIYGIEVGVSPYNAVSNSITRNVIASNNNNNPIQLTGNSQVYITGLINNFAWGQPPQNVTSGGTTTIAGNAYGDVLVNFNGSATIQLPTCVSRLGVPISVVDVGGFASDTNVITLLPNGTDTLIGNANYTITNPNGGTTLWPGVGIWYQK